MLGFSTLVLASRSWICSAKVGDDKRSLRRSIASGDQLNLSRGDGTVLVDRGRGRCLAMSISVIMTEWSDRMGSWVAIWKFRA